MIKSLLFVCLFCSYLFSNSTVVFSAANLKFLFSDIISEYNKIYPKDKIDVRFDSSGTIAKQLLLDRSYDLFLSANYKYAQKVYSSNKSATKPKIYTTGSLVLLIAKHNGLRQDNISILKDPTIEEITIANKKTAPYGMAAIEALKNAGIYKQVESKLFYSTDASNIIGDVLWYGHAGILPKSAINFLPRGYNIYGENWVDVDQSLYTPLKQYFVISKKGVKNKVTKRFIDFLLNEGQKILKQNGYK